MIKYFVIWFSIGLAASIIQHFILYFDKRFSAYVRKQVELFLGEKISDDEYAAAMFQSDIFWILIGPLAVIPCLSGVYNYFTKKY